MKKLTLMAAAMLLSMMSFAQVNLENGLVAYYPFNGNANDGSGNSQHGTVTGNVVLTFDRFNTADKAYNFAGATTDYVKAAGANVLNLGSSDLSLVFWMRHGSGAQNTRLGFLALNNASGDSVFQVMQSVTNFQPPMGPPVMFYTPFFSYISNGGMSSSAVSCNTLQPADANPYADGNWHMIAVTRQGTNLTMRIDSVVFSSTAGNTYLLNIDTILIGSIAAYGVPGDLDDVMIYNRTLSTQELDSIYSLTASIPSVPTGVNAIEASIEVSIFPNPIKNSLQLSFPTAADYQVRIFDAAGRQVATETIQNNNTLELNTSTWAAGLYALQIRDDKGGVVVKKVTKL